MCVADERPEHEREPEQDRRAPPPRHATTGSWAAGISSISRAPLIRGRGGEAAAVVLGDRRGDRQPVPAPPAAGARGRRERGDARREPGAVVGDLDPHPVARRPHPHPHHASPVLGRVADEVRARLGDPQRVGEDRGDRPLGLRTSPVGGREGAAGPRGVGDAGRARVGDAGRARVGGRRVGAGLDARGAVGAPRRARVGDAGRARLARGGGARRGAAPRPREAACGALLRLEACGGQRWFDSQLGAVPRGQCSPRGRVGLDQLGRSTSSRLVWAGRPRAPR